MNINQHRVCLLTDMLSTPLDEGMNRFAYQTALELSRFPGFRAFTNAEKPVQDTWVSKVPFGKSFGGRSLKRALFDCLPRHCVYIPRASLTMATMLRAWQLHNLLTGSHIHVLGLQRRPLTGVGRWLARKSRARFYVPSQFMEKQLSGANLRVTRMPPGVDTTRFRPATREEKKHLRANWNAPENRFIVAHIGPLRRSRNPAWFRALAQQPDVHLVLVGSESQAPDAAVLTDLRACNVTAITRYLPNIEDIYRMADAYFFPVLSPTGAIEWPLTVLEALSCGTPVITTRFGGLCDVAGECGALLFVERESDIAAAIKLLQSRTGLAGEARAWAEKRTWDRMLGPLLEAVQT